MCGIGGIVGRKCTLEELKRVTSIQHHRGPDNCGHYLDPDGWGGLCHNRLSIIDLTDAAKQPMRGGDGNLWITFNGEIYNYLELRSQLESYPFQTSSDTEVILAAYKKWGEECVEHFIGMFAFAIWDESQKKLFCARDRFGVKPFYYFYNREHFFFASEIKTFHTALKIPREFNETTWATYLSKGVYNHSANTFYKNIHSLLPGHSLVWQNHSICITPWYHFKNTIPSCFDQRTLKEISHDYQQLLLNSIQLRFRADVPVGINLSGGLDSSTLLALVYKTQGHNCNLNAFTFATNNPEYDELPWVRQLLKESKINHIICYLSAEEIPQRALEVQRHQDEPFGGFPTLAYSKIFQKAREMGVIVLLDGQGLDEQWAGYEYYANALNNNLKKEVFAIGPVQGSRSRSIRPECLAPEFRKLSENSEFPQPFGDDLRNLQYRDVFYTKIPRALRFNDRISMMYSTELREPFLDQRLFELAFKQTEDKKIRDGVHKWLLRDVVKKILPGGIVEAPKRPLQTPQREWLRGPLQGWVEDCIHTTLNSYGGIWFEPKQMKLEWQEYLKGKSDNSFYIWQWINLALCLESQID